MFDLKSFDAKTFKDDIALLQLDRAVPYSNKVSPICLPSKKIKYKPSEMAVVTGWGDTQGKKLQREDTQRYG